MKSVMTLCIVHQGNRVLLGIKKRGFGAGRWNGFGGKIKKGETIRRAAQREVLEEAGIAVADITPAGILEFSWRDKPDSLEVHVFCASEFTGEPHETEEMKPQWFSAAEIPFDAMWPDDRYWMPLVLADKKFRGRFVFDAADAILEYSLTEVNEI